MAIIEKPINLINVANTLGYYEYKPHPDTGVNSRYVDLGRLCTHPNVNPLSKHKPVRSPGIDPSTGDPNWWKTPNGMCSIEIPNSANYKTASTLQWVYLKPLGGASSPFRAGDFDGYDHNADSDLCSGYKTQISVALDDISNGITFGQTIPISTGSIKASDLDASNISGYYFSVILEAPNGTKIEKSATQTIGNGGNKVTFAKNEIDIALYEKQLQAYVVLSYNSLNDGMGGGTYYPACTFNGYLSKVPVYISNTLSIIVSGDYFLYDIPGSILPVDSYPTIELYRKYVVVLTVTNNFSNYQFPLKLSTFRFSYTDFKRVSVVDETATQWGANEGGSTINYLNNNDTLYLAPGQTILLGYKHDFFLRGGTPPADGTTINTGFKVTTLYNGQTKTVANTLPTNYKLNINK